MQTKTPLISVVMPTYNHGKFIFEAVSSVLNQTFQDFELLIIDNNSEDETDQVLSQFRDNRIRIYKIQNGGIIAKSRNVGIKLALGEWIAFIDSDDSWTSEKLDKAVKVINSKNDVIYHHLFILKENKIEGRIIARKLKRPILKDLLVKGNAIPNSSAMVRKNLILRVGGLSEEPNLVGIEDYNLWLKISKKSEGFHLLDETLGTFRKHQKNITNMEDYLAPISTLQKFEKYLSTREIKCMYALHDYIAGSFQYKKKNHSTAVVLFKKSLQNVDLIIRSKSFLKLVKIFISST